MMLTPLLLSVNAVVDGVNQDRDESVKTGLPLSNSIKVNSGTTIKESFDFNGILRLYLLLLNIKPLLNLEYVD